MFLRITTTYQPATDLGYLLHKHPAKFQSAELTVGKAHIFYTEATEERTSACLLLETDPIALVRGSRAENLEQFSLGRYVNDRPYVASSFMSVAIAKLLSSALNGRCKDKPELVNQPLPLEITIAVVAASASGDELIRKFFVPLGYEVNAIQHPLDSAFPDWGMSQYFTVTLTGTQTIQQALSHLYVLLPALDKMKHYYMMDEEVEKLKAKGEGWLATHPHKELIVRRSSCT